MPVQSNFDKLVAKLMRDQKLTKDAATRLAAWIGRKNGKIK